MNEALDMGFCLRRFVCPSEMLTTHLSQPREKIEDMSIVVHQCSSNYISAEKKCKGKNSLIFAWKSKWRKRSLESTDDLRAKIKLTKIWLLRANWISHFWRTISIITTEICLLVCNSVCTSRKGQLTNQTVWHFEYTKLHRIPFRFYQKSPASMSPIM